MKKVLVTGGAGFIGSHICEAYLHAGYEVGVVDNFLKDKSSTISQKCQIFKVNITNKKKLEKVFADFKPDIVNHHAAQTKIEISNVDPVADAKTNILGLLNVLDVAARHNIRHFIFASSAAVYGSVTKIPIDENVQLAPNSIYGISKMAGERYVQHFAKKNEFKATIFRYANVYGPNQLSTSQGGVVAIMINQLLKSKKVSIFGSGDQTRDFVYVKDIAKVNVIASSLSLAGVFNVGTGLEISINDLYRKLTNLVPVPVEPLKKPSVTIDISRSSLDAKKLYRQLPEFGITPLDTGLQETIDWFRTKK
jgi:UDP-glucose 4-epimerase